MSVDGSMIIRSIELLNYGPYYGSHTIELGEGDHPLVIVEGDNMAGKTSLLNTIRWALYRHAKGRDTRPMKTGDLVNRDALAEAEPRMSVKLNVTVHGKEVALLRQVTAKAGVSDPRDDDDFVWYQSIQVDNSFLESDQYDQWVETMLLPEGISRFFLFDGELLNEYEALVREGGEQSAALVRESIESVLGLPAARRARVDLQFLKADVSKRLQRANARDNRYRAAAEELASLEAKRDQLNRDRGDVIAQVKVQEDELRMVRENLMRYEETREEVGHLKKAQDELDRLRKQQVEKAERRQVLAKDLWRDVMAPRLQQETARLEEERDRQTTALARLAHLNTQRAQLTKDMDDGTCSQCGRGLEDSERARLRAELKRLEDEIIEVSKTADADRAEQLSGILRQLRLVAPAGITAAMHDVETDIQRLDLDVYKSEEDIAASERKLRGINTEQVLEWDRRSVQINERLVSLRAQRQNLDEEVARTDSEAVAARKKLLDNENPESQKLAREHDTLEVLEDLAARAVDELTDQLRVEVQAEATKIFLELTTDATYSGLRINDQYGLTIVRGDGSDVRVRSAGAEQVVALSLLGALNRMATMRGPVIMDTPFGRLDRKHRSNILNFLPRMADQVVLLIHDGEVDTERDLDPVREKISKRYKIVRDTASNRSEIATVGSGIHV